MNVLPFSSARAAAELPRVQRVVFDAAHPVSARLRRRTPAAVLLAAQAVGGGRAEEPGSKQQLKNIINVAMRRRTFSC